MIMQQASGLRLFQVMAGSAFGGAEAFFERLTLGLHEAGVAQTLAIRPWPQRMARLGGAGIDVRACGFSPFGGFMTRARLGRMAKKSRADVMLTWMNRATHLAPRSTRTGIPHVARLGGFYDLKYYRHCDLLVANTRAIADYLVRGGWPADKVHVQYNFVAGPEAGAQTVRKKNRKNKEVHFVSLGRFHHNKGFDVLLEAMRRIPDGRLSLAGEGAERDKLMRHAESLGIAGRVAFLPWQNNPQEFLAGGDIFICPSRLEPFGNVIIEAFAARLPVIATATDAAAEYLVHGKNAVVVPLDNADAMGDAMQYLAASPAFAKKIAGAGHKTFLRDFTKERVVQNWIAFLSEIA